MFHLRWQFSSGMFSNIVLDACLILYILLFLKGNSGFFVKQFHCFEVLPKITEPNNHVPNLEQGSCVGKMLDVQA